MASMTRLITCLLFSAPDIVPFDDRAPVLLGSSPAEGMKSRLGAFPAADPEARGSASGDDDAEPESRVSGVGWSLLAGPLGGTCDAHRTRLTAGAVASSLDLAMDNIGGRS